MGKGVMELTYLPYMLVGAAIVALIIIILCCRRYVINTFNAIDMILDRVLNKDTSLQLEITKDDRISKLTHKANRIVDMCISDMAQSKEEKESIQGFISDML